MRLCKMTKTGRKHPKTLAFSCEMCYTGNSKNDEMMKDRKPLPVFLVVQASDRRVQHIAPKDTEAMYSL